MQTIEQYITDRYNNAPNWFEQEVEQSNHIMRISNVVNNKEYLLGHHKILEREDAKWKGKQYITKKLILQQAKTIINFHSTYLLGKPLSLTGSEDKVKAYQNIYRNGAYNNIDYKILDNALKYGDAYEYVYIDNKNIVSKIIKSEDGYPIYSEDDGTYIGFIESYTINTNNVTYYNVYYPDKVEQWSNEGGDLHICNTFNNISGLPIHYSNGESEYDNFGVSLLDDIKPILDEYEDILSKMSDGIYTLSLNPIPVVIGQQVQTSIPADACGYAINLDNGNMDFKNATMDTNTIKLYLEQLKQELSITSHMPSVALGTTDIANVAEVSLKLMYQLADVYAMVNEQWFRSGLTQRFSMFDKLLGLLGVNFPDNDYVDVEFNYSRPQNSTEILQNMQTQYSMGAISRRTIIEKSPLTADVTQEEQRIQEEQNNKGNNSNNDNTNDDTTNNTDNDNTNNNSK